MVAWLAGLPRWVVILAVVALFLGGALAPGATGAVLCGVVAGLVAWLAALTWGSHSTGGRLARLAAVAALVALAVSKVT